MNIRFTYTYDHHVSRSSRALQSRDGAAATLIHHCPPASRPPATASATPARRLRPATSARHSPRALPMRLLLASLVPSLSGQCPLSTQGIQRLPRRGAHIRSHALLVLIRRGCMGRQGADRRLDCARAGAPCPSAERRHGARLRSATRFLSLAASLLATCMPPRENGQRGASLAPARQHCSSQTAQ